MKRALIGLALIAAPAFAIEVNDASLSDLVGAGFSQSDAEKIIATREANGPYTSTRDLLRIEGVSQGDLNRLRSTLTINGGPVTTRSGTAPAIPGVRSAVPAKKSGIDDSPDDDENEMDDLNDDHGQHHGQGNDDKDKSDKDKSGKDRDKSGGDKGGSDKGGKDDD